jgi:predicted component of type VI protein secretion system
LAAELSLEIVEGPNAGRTVVLDRALEIGRDPDAGFTVDDEHVSPRHVRVSPEGEVALVEDLGDPGGTFVNDSEVAAPTRIRPGDELQIGVTVLQLRTVAGVAAQSGVRPKPEALAATELPPGTTAPAPPPMDPMMEEAQELLDVHTKAKARNAPLALLVVVIFFVLLFVSLERFT